MNTTMFSRKTIAIALAAGVSLGGVTVASTNGAIAITPVASAQEAPVITQNTMTITLTPKTKSVTETQWFYMHPKRDPLNDLPTNTIFTLVSTRESTEGAFTLKALADNYTDPVLLDNNKNPLKRGESYTVRDNPYNSYGTVTLNESGDLVITMKDGRDYTNGIPLSITLKDKEGKNHTININPVLTSGMKMPTFEITRDPYKKGENEWGGFIAKPTQQLGNRMKLFPLREFVAFPVQGQPQGAPTESVDSVTEAGSTLVVPGEGTWKLTYDKTQFGEPGAEILFTPEDGFTGTPTPPHVGVSDISNNAIMANLSDYYHENFPEEAIQFFFYKDIEISEQPPVDNNEGIPSNDLHITDITKLDNDNYEITRNDGKTFTIDLSDLNKRIKDLEDKDSPSREEFDKVKNELKKAQDSINDLKGKDTETDKALQDLREDLNKLTPRVDQLEKDVVDLKNSAIKEVRDNGDGTYTLIRKDGSEVNGSIDTSGSVTDIKPDGKGNLIITIDGKEHTVPLAQTTVTEKNKGKPNHTVTITTPNGKSVTFNVFDKHVADITKLPNGNYEITRNDGTTWTIDLNDIRDKITDLEKKETVTPDQLNAVKDELAAIKNDIDGLKGKDIETDKAIQGLHEDLNKLTPRIDQLEKDVANLKNSIIKEVKKLPNGNYEIIRNDDQKWTIDLSDLNKRIKDLENKNSPSREEFDNLKNDLKKNQDSINSLKGKDAETDKIIKDIANKINNLEPRINKLENRVTTLEGLTIQEVKDNGDGTYTLIRANGDEVSGVINTTSSITAIKTDGKGNLIVTINGEDQIVPLDRVAITESNQDTPEHTITITTPDGKSVTFNAANTYVTDIKKLDNGDYEITRTDGKTWVIELNDLGKRIADLENKEDTTPDQVKAVKDELDKLIHDITALKATNAETDKLLTELRNDFTNITSRITTLEARVGKLEGLVIKEVRDNGDGTFTLIRKDGSEVNGNIDTSNSTIPGSVTAIATDGKGNLIATIDGQEHTIPLAQTTITETNKGTSSHTITITTPDGKTISLNVFDKHVVNVEKQADGNYLITRNDGTTWVIDLKDIRDKIANLENTESPSQADFDALKKELDELKLKVNTELSNVDNRVTDIHDDIANLYSDLNDLENRVTKIETRLTKVEDHANALTRCVYGAGMAGIPALLSIPLMLMAQMNMPGIKEFNTQIQKQIGVFNPELARQWERSGGILQAGAVLAGIVGIIGAASYVANECKPLSQTPAAQETDLGKLSSKLKSPEKDAKQ